MNNAWKGACLSGLVYPGAGQMVQRHYVRGIALIGAVTASLAAITLAAARGLEAMLVGSESGSGSFDVTTMVREAEKLSTSLATGKMKLASAVIVCCWAIGVVDAYLSGRRVDLEKNAPRQATAP